MSLQKDKHVDVIIVEDDPIISRMYHIKLSQAGYHILVATNGADSVKLVREHHPKLVLMDINMPEMTGIEAIRQLKSERYDFSRTAVVFLTNSNSLSDIEQAADLGAGYIMKSDQTPRQVLMLIQAKIGKVSV